MIKLLPSFCISVCHFLLDFLWIITQDYSFPPSCTVQRPGFSFGGRSGYWSGFINAACAPSLASNGKTTCRTKTLNWKTPNQSSCMTLRPMMLHHHTRFGYRSRKVRQLWRYRPDEHSLEFWTFSVTLILTTTEQSNFFTRQSTLQCAIKPNLVAKGPALQKT